MIKREEALSTLTSLVKFNSIPIKHCICPSELVPLETKSLGLTIYLKGGRNGFSFVNILAYWPHKAGL